MNIKKFVCKQHGVIATRKGLRDHIKEYHAKDEYTKSNAWQIEEWGDKK